MNVYQKINRFLELKYVPWLIFSLIALYFSLKNRYLTSMDGPAHIHSSILLGEYFKGHEALDLNYALHAIHIPNLFSNYYMMVLTCIFGSKIGVGIFYFSLLFLQLFSAFYLLKSFKVKAALLLSLAFIVLYNGFLLNIGFYNFTFSVAFLMFGIGFVQRNFKENKPTALTYLIYFLILFLLYYSNGLSFGFFVLYFAIVILTRNIRTLLMNSEKKLIIMQWIILFFLTLPFVIMLYMFQHNSNANFGWVDQSIDKKAYWDSLLAFSSFIVYNRPQEEGISSYLFMALIVLFFTSLLVRFWQRRYKPEAGDTLLLFCIGCYALYFIVPDNYSVGMMSPRLQFFFYLFILLWTFIQNGVFLKYLVAIYLCFGSFYKFKEYQHNTLKALNADAKKIVEAGKYIEPFKTVATLNYSDNWLEAHFADYLGFEKPIVMLDNYEASVGWFPLRWNIDRIPVYTAAGRKSFQNFGWNIRDGADTKEVDYLFIYGGDSKIAQDSALKELLDSYVRVDKRELQNIAIYKRNWNMIK